MSFLVPSIPAMPQTPAMPQQNDQQVKMDQMRQLAAQQAASANAITNQMGQRNLSPRLGGVAAGGGSPAQGSSILTGGGSAGLTGRG